jgi:membrane protease YdiL (CAAX protease family)
LAGLFPSQGWSRLCLSPQLFFLVAVLLIRKIRKFSFQEIGLSGRDLPKKAGIGFLLGWIPVIVVLAAAFLATWVDTLHPFLPRPIFARGLLPGSLPDGPRMVTLLLLAPISEELFFRGVLLKGLREHYPDWLAVAASALVFTAAHGSLAAGPMVLGLVNGFIVVRTGSIVPGIVFHTISNTYGPAMAAWLPNLVSYLRFLYP